MNSRQLARHIYYYYVDNPTGGNCHIVLDDHNLNNCHIEFCIEKCKKEDDVKGLFIMEQMIAMRKTARGKSIKTAWELRRNNHVN